MQPKDGDRIMIDNGVEVVVTPLVAPNNFGPASDRDSILYTSERPGGDPTDGAMIQTGTVVPEWAQFMTEHGVHHVLVLLSDDEMEQYDGTGLMEAYKENGFTAYHIPAKSDQAAEKIWNLLQEMESKQQKIVAHCTHGMGRSGRIAAFWLAKRYDLSVEEASEEALDAARKHGVERMGKPLALQQFMS